MDFARFQQLSTPLVADACMRLGLPPRVAPAGLSPIDPKMKVAGAVLPTQHHGSVDVFLEAYEARREERSGCLGLWLIASLGPLAMSLL